MSGRASCVKMVGMAEVGAPISLDGMAVHPDCWCICLCYLHFAAENPEDGEMYLMVPAHPGCPGQSPQSRKMVVYVCEVKIKCLSGYTDSSANRHKLLQDRSEPQAICIA